MTRPRPQLSFAQDQDGGAILDPQAGTITTLNQTGAFVWRGLVEGKSPTQLAAELARATETDESIALNGVMTFLSEPRIRLLLVE